MDNLPISSAELPVESDPSGSPSSPYKWIIIFCVIVLLIIVGVGAYVLNITAHSVAQPFSMQPVTGNSISPANTIPTVSVKQTNVLDTTKLPLGDGKYGNTPKVGYIYTCQQQFNGGGAQVQGSWIHGSTWSLQEKIAVRGDVSWSNAQLSMTTNETSRQITGNGLPLNTKTGIFPIASIDPAYQIDKNPNSIKAQNISYALPLNPVLGSTPACIHGMVGITTNGVAIFDGLDAGGRDAVANEVQDICDGHPEITGEYHYHGPSKCLINEKANNTLIGYAFDGFGIYSMYDANGKEYTNADLDECHGTTSEVMWNGKMQKIYHYVLTQEYPYTVGCFRGSIVKEPTPSGSGRGNLQGPPQNDMPPQGQSAY